MDKKPILPVFPPSDGGDIYDNDHLTPPQYQAPGAIKNTTDTEPVQNLKGPGRLTLEPTSQIPGVTADIPTEWGIDVTAVFKKPTGR